MASPSPPRIMPSFSTRASRRCRACGRKRAS
ncbi:hypothetical protein IMW75_18800 [Pseudomonas gregormendelii]|uniref:Uncharacterized protein n=1 Tax=Pseudomonas gregormendelii TaxID=1628277 RepID=A0ABS3AM77_9PSED|nr:hypothetical protein [Pseudomonas gregormendelii]MCA4962223.1 hypothetical protein [Pseudomonas sp. Y24-6]MCH4878983.1 hypothetical protein [Pseudomonas sp. TMW22090]